jgi:hypothetical protein
VSSGGASGLCPPGSDPVTLATGLDSPWDIALDDSDIYFSLGDDPGGISRVPKIGGAVTQLANGPSRVHHFVLGGDRVYFAASVAGQVLRVGKDGTGLTPLAEFQHFPEGIALMDQDVYWVYESGGVHGGLVRLASGTTEPVEVVPDLHDPWDLKPFGPWLYFSTLNDAAQPRAIYRYHTKSQQLQKVFEPGFEVNDFEVTDPVIYFTTNVGLSRYLVDSGTMELLAEGNFITYGVALSGASVFAADTGTENDGRILRYDVVTGNVTVIASAQDWPRHVAADENCVYWTNQGFAGTNTGSILRGPR